jgi:tyrosyl-tRNA synthetase
MMNAMVPGLTGGKMSSSDPNSKIDILDPPELVKKKINLAFCEEGNVSENGVLSFVQAVLIPVSQLRLERAKGLDGVGAMAASEDEKFVADDAPEGTVFTVQRKPEYGGSIHYSSFEQLEADFASKALHPGDLKVAVTKAVNSLLNPIRKAFASDEEWQKVEKLAYPDPVAKPEKKKKKV